MRTKLKKKYVKGRFVQFNSKKMISLGELTKERLDLAPRFPAPWTDAWSPFVESVGSLLLISAAKANLTETLATPGVGLDVVKDAIRTFGNLVISFKTSTVPETRESANILYDQIIPKGLDPITEGHHDVSGWTALTLTRLEGVFHPHVERVHAVPTVKAMRDAYVEYKRLSAWDGISVTIPENGNARDALNLARDNLEWALIDMESMLRYHPDLLPEVQSILGPLDDMMERETAKRRKNKDTVDDDDSETPEEEEIEEEEEEASDEDELEEEDVEEEDLEEEDLEAEEDEDLEEENIEEEEEEDLEEEA